MAKDEEGTATASTDEDQDAQSGEDQKVNVTVEDAGAGRKHLTVEIPAERVEEQLEQQYRKLMNEATVPGFRRGRAPRRLIERKFSSTVAGEVRAELISDAYGKAVEQENLDVVGEPDIKDVDKIELPEKGPLVFQVDLEVVPEITLPKLEGMEVKKPEAEVSDNDVKAEVTQLQNRLGTVKAVEDATAEEEDLVVADLSVLPGSDAEDDAEPLVNQTATYIRIPTDNPDDTGHIGGIVVEDLRGHLVGRKGGDTLRISTTGPASHENERIRNEPITIVLVINRVERVDPASVEKVIEQFAMSTIDDLNRHVRNMLEDRRDRRVKNEMRQQIRDHLLKTVELELPEGLTGRQTDRILRRRSLELASAGLPENEVEQRVANARTESEELAKRELKLFFILSRVAKELEVEVTDQEVNGQIAFLAAEQGRRMEKLRQDMKRNGELEHLYLLMQETKSLDRILESAKIN